MVDLPALRQKIHDSAARRNLLVSKSWLEEVERDLSELAERRATETRQ